MATFYDPINQDNIEIDESTILYLVKVTNNTFAIKGLSSGIIQLASDPTTHAIEYWPINTITLMNNQLSNHFLFPNNALNTEPLTLKEVMDHLGFDPNKILSKNRHD